MHVCAEVEERIDPPNIRATMLGHSARSAQRDSCGLALTAMQLLSELASRAGSQGRQPGARRSLRRSSWPSRLEMGRAGPAHPPRVWPGIRDIRPRSISRFPAFGLTPIHDASFCWFVANFVGRLLVN